MPPRSSALLGLIIFPVIIAAYINTAGLFSGCAGPRVYLDLLKTW